MNQNTAATSTSPVTVLLTNHQAAMLDEIAAAVRRDTGRVLSRSAMIRAVLSAVIPHYRDLLQCCSEEDVRQVIARRLEVRSK